MQASLNSVTGDAHPGFGRTALLASCRIRGPQFPFQLINCNEGSFQYEKQTNVLKCKCMHPLWTCPCVLWLDYVVKKQKCCTTGHLAGSHTLKLLVRKPDFLIFWGLSEGWADSTRFSETVASGSEQCLTREQVYPLSCSRHEGEMSATMFACSRHVWKGPTLELLSKEKGCLEHHTLR